MAYFNLGNAYQELKNYDMAIKNFQATIAIENSHTDAIFNLGIAYQDRANLSQPLNVDDLNKALKCYEEVNWRCPGMNNNSKIIAHVIRSNVMMLLKEHMRQIKQPH